MLELFVGVQFPGILAQSRSSSAERERYAGRPYDLTGSTLAAASLTPRIGGRSGHREQGSDFAFRFESNALKVLEEGLAETFRHHAVNRAPRGGREWG